jgi:hypothetical protein
MLLATQGMESKCQDKAPASDSASPRCYPRPLTFLSLVDCCFLNRSHRALAAFRHLFSLSFASSMMSCGASHFSGVSGCAGVRPRWADVGDQAAPAMRSKRIDEVRCGFHRLLEVD